MKTTMLLTGCLVCFLCMGSGLVQAAASFSFLVVGDTRTEPFLPGGQEQKVKILQVLQERYRSSSKDTQLTFDALGEELVVRPKSFDMFYSYVCFV